MLITLEDIRHAVFKNRGTQCRFFITESGVGLKLYQKRGLRDHDYRHQLNYWAHGFCVEPGDKFEVTEEYLRINEVSPDPRRRWYGFTTRVCKTLSQCGRSGHLDGNAPPEVVNMRQDLLDRMTEAGLKFVDSHWGNFGLMDDRLYVLDTSMGTGYED